MKYLTISVDADLNGRYRATSNGKRLTISNGMKYDDAECVDLNPQAIVRLHAICAEMIEYYGMEDKDSDDQYL